MAIKLKIYNQKAEQVGEMEVADEVFGKKANESLVHQALIAQMSNERQVLAHTKTKGEVRGGGKKPWKQKGTGRARAGSSRSPLWIGGGVTFGPLKDRNFKKKINKRMKRNALLMVLSDRIRNDNFFVMDKFDFSEYKTKQFNAILKNLENLNKEIAKEKRSMLVINDKNDRKVSYSARNIAGVKIINLNNINILDLLKCKKIIATADAVRKMEETYKQNNETK